MKIFTVAAVALALIAMPAQAQLNAKRHQGDAKKDEPKAQKIDEKAYKAALERIPSPRKNMIRGASHGRQSRQRNRNSRHNPPGIAACDKLIAAPSSSLNLPSNLRPI